MSNRLPAWRKERGLTQRQLAAYLKVTYQTVNAWEHGRPMPHIVRLAIRQWDAENRVTV